MKRLITIIGIFLLFLAPVSAKQKNIIKQPEYNLVYILMDDVGYSDLGVYGGQVLTPNINQLAVEGMSFSNYYSAGAMCSPTRFSTLTGDTPLRTGIKRAFQPQSQKGIPQDYLTLAESLKAANYDTGHIGKWHVGHAEPEFLPQSVGFSYSARLLDDETFDHLDENFLLNEQVLESTVGHTTQVMTDYATEFIRTRSLWGKSFFLNLWYIAPHAPHNPPEGWQDIYPYPDTEEGRYMALLSDLDAKIGEVVSELKRQNLYEKTIIIIASDNGGAELAHPNGNTGLKGFKQQLWEGGIKVPFIIKAPFVPKNTWNDSVMVSYDFFPTIAEILSTGFNQNGVSKSPAAAFLKNTTVARGQDLHWEEKRSATQVLTNRDRFAVRRDNWKYVFENGDFLFDLANDPAETTNLKKTFPALTAELKSAHIAFRNQISKIPFTQTGDTIPHNVRFNFGDRDFTIKAKVPGIPGNVLSKGMAWNVQILPDGKLQAFFQGQNGTNTTLTSLSSVPANSDIMITVYGYNSIPATVRMYVNGVLQQETNEMKWGVRNTQDIAVGTGVSNLEFHLLALDL